MSPDSPFDAETEAFLATVQDLAQSVPAPPPLRAKQEPAPGAHALAAKELEHALSEGTSAPPVSMSARDAIRIGDEAKREALAKLDAGAPAPARKRGKHAPTKTLGTGHNPNRPVGDSTIARFASSEVDTSRVFVLGEDHPAVVEGRTLFPGTVVDTFSSPRFLVSGHNNPKLGKIFQKGPWAGMPLYQLSLEERATCPRSCLQWRSCYGNAMHMARRHDHRDPDFIFALKAEVITMARAHPDGVVIRLHTLGDFYSVEYVRLWADLLDTLPNLRIFGYTARREDADDEESRTIAKAIRWLTEQAWDVFAIRFSGRDGPQGSIVVTEDDERDHVIMCPAQKYQTAACVTCGLCASAEARDKTIGFLLHGLKRGPEARVRSTGEDKRTRDLEWRRRYEDDHDSLKVIADAYNTSPGAVHAALKAMGVTLRSRSEGMRLAINKRDERLEASRAPRETTDTLTEEAAPRADRIAASKLEGVSAADVIANARASISIGGRRS